MNRVALLICAAISLAGCCEAPTPTGHVPKTSSDMRTEVSVGANSAGSRIRSSDERLVITNGTLAGMCVGYCRMDMMVAGTFVSVVFKEYGRGRKNLPDSVVTGTISEAEWSELVSASAAMSSFTVPDTTIGCPDCADQGAEYVALEEGSAGRRRVAFEPQKPVARIQPLIDRLRAIRQRIAGR